MANTLEVFLSLNTILLLLLKNTEQVVDQLQTYSSKTSCHDTANATCRCDSSIEGLTPLTWLLLPFYYIPLATTVVAAIGWLAVQIRYSLNSCAAYVTTGPLVHYSQ